MNCHCGAPEYSGGLCERHLRENLAPSPTPHADAELPEWIKDNPLFQSGIAMPKRIEELERELATLRTLLTHQHEWQQEVGELRAKNERLRHTVSELEERAHRLALDDSKQLARAREAEKDNMKYVDEIVHIRAQLAEAQKDRDALKAYVKHWSLCDSIQRDKTGCICGLTSLLNALAAMKG